MSRLLCAAAITVASVLTIRVQASPQDNAKQAIQEAWAPVAQALIGGDMAAAAKSATADFQFVDVFGRPGPAGQWTERNKTIFANVKSPTIAPDVLSVTPKGDATIAVVKAKITGTGLDRLGMEGPLDLNVIYRTEWVKDGTTYKLKIVREAMFQGTANRRPVKLTTSAAEDMVRTQFQPFYGAIADTYEKGAFDETAKSIPPDYEIYDMDGQKLNGKDFIERVKGGAKILQSPLVSFDPQQVMLDGDRVVVVRICKIMGDVSLPGGQMGRVVYTQSARETFVKGEKGFQPKSITELHSEATLNGMPLPLALISGKP